MKHLPIILLAAVMMAGCKKDEDCVQNNYGIGCFENSSSMPIAIKLDGNPLYTIAPYQSRCEEQLSVGIHDIFADDGSSVWLTTITITQCETNTITLISRCDTVVCNNGGNCAGGSCECLPGFTGSHCEKTITGMKITSVTISSYAGTGWDVFSDPDIYIIIEGPVDSWSSLVVDNAANNTFYSIPGLPITLANYTFNYPVEFYDWDDPGAELMLSLQIRPSDYQLSQSFIAYSANGWNISFNIEWLIN